MILPNILTSFACQDNGLLFFVDGYVTHLYMAFVGSKLKKLIPGFPDRSSVVYWDGDDYGGHGYGHRKGRGNRWDHKIDDLILDYMIEADTKYQFHYHNWRDPHRHRRERYVKHHAERTRRSCKRS